MTPTTRESIIKMVRDAFPELAYALPRTYVVRATHADGSLDLDPPPDASDLAPLNNVPQWGLGQVLVTPDVGTAVCVVFREGKRERAIMVGFAPASPGSAAAREGDLAQRVWTTASGGHLTALYVSTSVSAPYAWSAVPVQPAPPTSTDAGTALPIAQGSGKVTVG